MSYLNIRNLYQDTTILLFLECYALEKLNGTSAAVKWLNGCLTFSSGGAPAEEFAALFDREQLAETLHGLFGWEPVTIYGEAYGGAVQGQSAIYGPALRFAVFDVRRGPEWLTVLAAERLAERLGLEFVPYRRLPATLEVVTAERDAPSVQAERNGLGSGQPREGVVLRPLTELLRADGQRVICKHKTDAERETNSPRVVGRDPGLLTDPEQIAEEWVTYNRLQHVLQRLPAARSLRDTAAVIEGMVADVLKESPSEIVDGPAVRKALSAKTAKLWREYLKRQGAGKEETHGPA